MRGGPEGRHWQRLLGKHAPKAVLARDEEGRVHKLVTRGEAVKALKEAGHRFAVQAAKDATGEDPYARQAREQQKKQRQREETLRAVSRAAIGQVGLTRSRGHLARGAYDVRYGTGDDGETGTSAVL